MFFRILKRDIKRKKTMNIILLLFVIMCSMFASASINNIYAVSSGIDGYFEKADVSDIVIYSLYDSDVDETLRSRPDVKDIKVEHLLTVLDSRSFSLNGKKFNNYTNVALIMNDGERVLNLFDENNDIIPPVEKGTFYATASFSVDSDIKAGDIVELSAGSIKKTLEYKGRIKSALAGSSSSDSPLLIFSPEDYNDCQNDTVFYKPWGQKQIYVNTDDPDAVLAYAKDISNVYAYSRDEMKTSYFYDMLVAYLMIVISVLLMLTGFVILRFTIQFTIGEEFHEISVMKAIGIGNRSIRVLYIIKYLGIAVTGSLTGFFCSIPLSKMMLNKAATNMVLDTKNDVLLGLISSCVIVFLILLFCFLCTRRVNKLSPIDAVRNGQTGERFGRKSLLHLGRSRLPASGFLPLNDILSAPKQFALIGCIFTICLIMMTSVSNFVITLKSDRMIPFFSIAESHITTGDVEDLTKQIFDDVKVNEYIDKTEKMLADNGMPAQCTVSTGGIYDIVHKDTKKQICCIITKGIPAESFPCDEGYSPRYPDEISMTGKAMKELNAKIGDTVKISFDGKEYDFIISGRFSSYMGGGMAARLHESFTHSERNTNVINGLQIYFYGDPDNSTIRSNIEKLKQLFDTDKIYTNSELADKITGLSDTLNSVKYMMMILTAIISALIVILMERSFISKEKGEIALMKAIGVKERSIIAQHVMRFVILSVSACLLAALLTLPFSYLMFNWVSSMIGDVSNISPMTDKTDTFLICPGIIIGVTTICSFLTALYTKTIKASDTASIE